MATQIVTPGECISENNVEVCSAGDVASSAQIIPFPTARSLHLQGKIMQEDDVTDVCVRMIQALGAWERGEAGAEERHRALRERLAGEAYSEHE